MNRFMHVPAVLLLPLLLLLSSATDCNAFENRIGMRFVKILPGTFLMGSPASEKGRERDEKLHRVKLTKGFYISVTEVTQDQWIKIMGDNPSSFPECGLDCPVDNVSWYDCKLFIKKLNRREQTAKYRLPTEAEWEYAARAGSRTAFPSGDITEIHCGIDRALDRIGWYCGNSGERNPVGNKKPHPVARKTPNAWGIHDMNGNVQEWVQDSCKWRSLLKGRVGVITDTYRDNIENPLSRKGDRKIFRGGSWNTSARYSRSANRSYFRPKAVRNNIGFRVVRSL